MTSPPHPQNLDLGKENMRKAIRVQQRISCSADKNMSTGKKVKEKHKRFLIFFAWQNRSGALGSPSRQRPAGHPLGSRRERAQPGTGAARARAA